MKLRRGRQGSSQSLVDNCKEFELNSACRGKSLQGFKQMSGKNIFVLKRFGQLCRNRLKSSGVETEKAGKKRLQVMRDDGSQAVVEAEILKKQWILCIFLYLTKLAGGFTME